jgi:hypothetical protein
MLVSAYYMLQRDEPYREVGADWFDQRHADAHTRRLVAQLIGDFKELIRTADLVIARIWFFDSQTLGEQPPAKVANAAVEASGGPIVVVVERIMLSAKVLADADFRAATRCSRSSRIPTGASRVPATSEAGWAGDRARLAPG